MKRKLAVVLPALVMALLLGLSVFFVACDSSSESGGQNTEQSGGEQEGTEQGGGNEGETGGESGEEDETGGETGEESGGETGDEGETGGEDPAPVPDVSDKLVFTLNDEGTAYSVTDMDTSAAGSVTIPSTYNGLPVTSIDSSAFAYCNSLVEITILEGVTSIGSFAFAFCVSLMEIVIPESVMSIGSRTFYGCSSLAEITIPDSVASIGSEAFSYCSSLAEITIPDGVASIGSRTFSGCRNLTEIAIPASVTSIGVGAFSYCSGLAEIAIPDSVTSIGSSAFSNCSGLAEITIPASVTSIGGGAFQSCSGLTKINYNAASVAGLTINSRVFQNAGSNSDGITVIFGESVTSVPAYLFYRNSSDVLNLVSVTIGNNVTSIGEQAFRGCSGLTEVTLGEGVTSIGDWAFYNCSGLTEINYNAVAVSDLASASNVFYNAGSDSDGITVIFGESVISIPADLFNNQYNNNSVNITSVTIGSNVESIGPHAFYGCSGLTEITIPDSVTSIGAQAFSHCYGLTEVTLGEGVESIGTWAFSGCSKLIEVYNQSSLDITAGSSNYGDVAYYAKNVYTQEGGSWFTDTTEGYRFFYDGSNGYLMGYYGAETALTLPASFTAYDGTEVSEYEIYTYALYGYSELTSVTIPDSVTSIGSYAFYNCSNLTKVTLGEGVESIGTWAFSGCSKLIEVYNQSSLDITAGSSNYGDVAYYAKNVYTQEGGSWFTDTTEGYRFFYDGSNGYLMGYYGAETALTLPASFTAYDGTEVSEYEIYTYALYGYSELTSVTIPDSVTSIGSQAFYKCSNLTSVTFETVEGWWYASSSTATSGTEIASSDLADPVTAATYLVSTYDDYYWHRS